MATHPKILADKAMAQIRAGQFNAAFKTAKAAAKEHPRESFFLNLAGLSQVQMGNPKDGIDWFRKAIRVSPTNMDAHLNLLQTYAVLGERAHAVALADRILPKVQDREPILYLRAMAEQNAGDSASALKTLNTLLADNAASSRALNLRGVILSSEGEDHRAEADFLAALALSPMSPECLTNLARLLSKTGRIEEALDRALASTRANPAYLDGWRTLGSLYLETGDVDAALETYNRLREIAPADTDVLLSIALIIPESRCEDFVAEIERRIPYVSKASHEHAIVLIALGMAKRKTKDREEGYRLLAEGRRILMRHKPYDVRGSMARIDRIKAIFERPEHSSPTKIDIDPVPVFVLGLPRSGTTLAEQVLSNHPDIFGAGELAFAEVLVTKFLSSGQASFDTRAAEEFALEYIARLPDAARGHRYVVDKMPNNYLYVGFLARAFPTSPIICIHRDPRDVGLSMWNAFLGSPALAYTHDQAAMAEEMNAFRRLMTFWDQVLPDRLHHLSYETLVSDIDSQSKNLARIVGVEWMPGMAHPETNTAPVRTASLLQVRQPVSTKSVGGWKQNSSALQILLERLEPALWPELDLS